MTESEGIRVIECSGTPYEIGRQYGEQAAESLHRSAEIMFAGMGQAPYFAGRDAVAEAAQQYLPNVRIFDPEAIDWVRGLAAGAGISFEHAFALQCYTELVVNYPGLAGMCTSFSVAGPAAKNGITMVGQNVDWIPGATIDLLKIRHRNGLTQLCVHLLGYGALYLTSSGLANCATLTLCPLGPVTNHIPLAFYLSTAMRQRTLADAISILQQTARVAGYYHLADEAGNMAGIESVYDGFTDVQPEAGVLVHANHYETEQYRTADGAYLYIKDSFNRAARMRELISASYGNLTPERMMAILTDHGGHPFSICRHRDESKQSAFASETVASVVMMPAEGRMLLALGAPCNSEYVEYRL